MEFYSTCADYEILQQRLFQFPTGWNSTKKDIEKEHIFLSFNSQRDGILLEVLKLLPSGQDCFNSQRDGILPCVAKCTVGII